MRLALLAAPDSWYVRDLKRAACGQHEIVVLPHTRLVSQITNSGSIVSSRDVELGRCDAVLVRTMPPGSLEQVVFRMDALAELVADGLPVLNSPKAIECAVDKYLALARLRAAGLDVPSTIACQTVEDACRAFDDLGGDVVLKPLFGGEGRGIVRVSDHALARRAFQLMVHVNSVIYLQQYVPHDGFDLRLFVLGGEVLGMRRRNSLDWRTNVSRGATAEPIDVPESLAQSARLAAQAVGAEIAGVDFLPSSDGRQYAIEVNAVPGWKALAKCLRIDIAKRVLAYVRQCVERSAMMQK